MAVLYVKSSPDIGEVTEDDPQPIGKAASLSSVISLDKQEVFWICGVLAQVGRSLVDNSLMDTAFCLDAVFELLEERLFREEVDLYELDKLTTYQ